MSNAALSWGPAARDALVIVANLGLIAAFIIEHSQILAKYQGARRLRVAAGYNNAMKLMVVNRVGNVFYFFCIALAIELAIETHVLGAFFIGSISLVCLANLLIVRFSSLWEVCQMGGLSKAMRGYFGILLATFVANIFSILGMTLPMILGSKYPDFRLTLANSGFMLNAVFTVINVFVVESFVAKLIDQKDSEMGALVALIFLVRSCSAALCAGAYAFVLGAGVLG